MRERNKRHGQLYIYVISMNKRKNAVYGNIEKNKSAWMAFGN